MIVAVINGVNAMHTKQRAIIKNRALRSYMEFVTSIESLIPNTRMGKNVGKINIDNKR